MGNLTRRCVWRRIVAQGYVEDKIRSDKQRSGGEGQDS